MTLEWRTYGLGWYWMGVRNGITFRGVFASSTGRETESRALSRHGLRDSLSNIVLISTLYVYAA